MSFSFRIEALKDLNPIEDVIERYAEDVKFKSNGDILCKCPNPNHKDKSPSCHVSIDKQQFNCFGCPAGGDVISLVMYSESVDFKEAVDILASQSGHEFEWGGGENLGSEKLGVFYRVVDSVTKVFSRAVSIPKFSYAKEYLHSRGLSDRTIAKLSIGYNPPRENGEFFLVTFDKMSEASRVALKELNIISEYKSKVDDSINDRDTFAGRVVIPVRNKSGKVVGFTGRNIHSTYEKTPKYVNSYDSDIFVKQNLLLGVYESKNMMFDEPVKKIFDYMVLNEGGMDFAACFNHQVPSAATLGTALSYRQALTLWQNTKHVYLMYDNDEAGKRGIMQNLKILLSTMKPGKTCSVVASELGKDSAEILETRGKPAYMAELSKSIDALQYITDHFCANTDPNNPSQLLELCNNVAEYLSGINNSLVSNHIRHMICKRMDITHDMIPVIKKNAKMRNNTPNFNHSTKPTGAVNSDVLMLLAALNTKPYIAQYIQSRDQLNQIEVDGISIFKHAVAVYTSDPDIPPRMAMDRFKGKDVEQDINYSYTLSENLKSMDVMDLVDLINNKLKSLYKTHVASFNKDDVERVKEKFTAGEVLTPEEVMLITQSSLPKSKNTNINFINTEELSEFLTKNSSKDLQDNSNQVMTA